MSDAKYLPCARCEDPVEVAAGRLAVICNECRGERERERLQVKASSQHGGDDPGTADAEYHG